MGPLRSGPRCWTGRLVCRTPSVRTRAKRALVASYYNCHQVTSLIIYPSIVLLPLKVVHYMHANILPAKRCCFGAIVYGKAISKLNQGDFLIKVSTIEYTAGLCVRLSTLS